MACETRPEVQAAVQKGREEGDRIVNTVQLTHAAHLVELDSVCPARSDPEGAQCL